MIQLVVFIVVVWTSIGLVWGSHELIAGRHERHQRYGADRPRDLIAFLFISAFLGCYIFFGMMLDGG
jgi:hypothetical protein